MGDARWRRRFLDLGAHELQDIDICWSTLGFILTLFMAGCRLATDLSWAEFESCGGGGENPRLRFDPCPRGKSSEVTTKPASSPLGASFLCHSFLFRGLLGRRGKG